VTNSCLLNEHLNKAYTPHLSIWASVLIGSLLFDFRLDVVAVF